MKMHVYAARHLKSESADPLAEGLRKALGGRPEQRPQARARRIRYVARHV